MLDGTSSILAHRLQNLSLLLLSLVFFPLDMFILAISFFIQSTLHNKATRSRDLARNKPAFQRRTVLVTGVGMTKGLAIARLFYQAGHDVIGADFEPDGALVCGRVSKSLRRFYRLGSPDAKNGSALYIQSLLDIIAQEKVDLWISCSGVASAVEDGMAKEVVEARTPCKAIQFDVKSTQTLHEKHSFIEYTKSMGLTVPDTHEVTSRAAVEDILRDAPGGRKYILKTIGVDDSVRGDMTLLSKDSASETSKYIARLRISFESPWILQQFIKGREYCTHSLVIGGRVKAFVACPSAELLMHYEALPSDSPLSKAMLQFTTEFAAKGGPGFTGHLSFDFMVVDDGDLDLDGGSIALYPIECNPRAHTAVALFNGSMKMVDGYLSVLQANTSLKEDVSEVITPVQKDSYYWVGHDLVTLLLLPTLSFLTFDKSLSDLVRDYAAFVSHLLTWRDGTYETWDPLPWWWLYHVYWPERFLTCLRAGQKWSRLNVSTTKMFQC
ncbi:hypothetical protein A1O1_01842 [Capronia coronata CBS 617.96]|uniref:ATP-grasp domain-containing protein n=1 Tax=Capronia coronata CBS 617.96 TaxID=1182541 RepID=W9YUV6_9EURO|nr:uncharacterized protein A1O1_01842 [Capronia coronata CBS 617.96]EXJ93450.1 hypothetical protein A1O1_01842 [Capronia coronata CBS 617.96]